jgi:hypothetical protein
MDTRTQFAELLIFLRKNPSQRAQLRALLTEVVVTAESEQPQHTPNLISEAQAADLIHLTIDQVRKEASNGHYVLHRIDKHAYVDRDAVLVYQAQNHALGFVTRVEAAALIQKPLAYVRRGAYRGWWHTEGSWVRLQDVVDHVLKNGHPKQRRELVDRLDAREAAHRRSSFRVIDMEPRMKVVATEQPELALFA